jgi:hypothetical protein
VALVGTSVPLDGPVLHLRLAEDRTGAAEHRALLLFDAVLASGETGVLVAVVDRQPVLLEGRLAGTASTVTLTANQTRRTVAVDGDVFAKPQASGPLRDALDAASFGTDAFFGDLLRLGASGPVTVRGERLVLVTAQGARELGGNASLSSAGRILATAAAEDSRASAPLSLEVTQKRGQAVLQAARGDARISGRPAIPLQGDAVLTLGKGSTLALTPSAEGVQATLAGRAFQVYAGGAARIPSALRLEIETTSFTLARNETAGTPFRLVATDPDADPVITAIRVEGGPARSLVLPGYVPLTQQLVESVGGDPFGTLVVAPVLPVTIIADALLGFLDALFGPAKVTQSIEAGTTFSSVLTVVGDDAPYTATLVLEGNFPTQRVPVRVA